MFELQRIAECGLIEQIDFHEVLGSTSDRALEIGAKDEPKLPLLVLAGRQTAGRGRGSNRWLTSEGALTFSLVLEAPIERLPLQNRPQVALVAGVAVAEALEQYVPRDLVQLKWPNDVYVRGRKAGGILSESIPGWRDRFVVGIGVNVNNRIRGVGNGGQGVGGDAEDSTIARIATSLVEESGIQRDLTSVLLAVLDEFDRRWRELLDRGFNAAANVYRQRCFLSGKTVSVELWDGSRVAGSCRGIDDFGGLIVRTPSGEKSLISGSVVGWDS